MASYRYTTGAARSDGPDYTSMPVRTLEPMSDTPLFRLAIFTKDSAAKAIIASSGVAFSTIWDTVCARNQATTTACSVIAGVSVLLKILLALMALDLFTGTAAAWVTGDRITSRRLGVGMVRKTTQLVIVAVAAMLDGVFHERGLPTGDILYKWTACWFIAVEALSLYENASRMGVPMPGFLKGAIEWLLQRAGKSGNVVPAIPPVPVEPEPTTPESK